MALDPVIAAAIADRALGDEVMVPLPDGRQFSLGQLRAFVGDFVPKQDLESLQRQAHDQQQAFLREKQLLEQQLIDRLAMTPQTPTPPEVYQTDPLFKPLWDKASEIDSVKDTLKQMQQLQQQMFQTVQQIPVVMSVQKIQSVDKDVDGQKLLEFAKEHQIQPHRLDDAHLLMTRERDLQRAREEGRQLGFDKAKEELAQTPAVPYAPFGPPQVVPNQPLKFESDQALEQAILGDTEIQQVYTGQRDWTAA